MQCFYCWSERLMVSVKDLFHRMKRRDFLFWLPPLLSLCFSELRGRHGRISCSVWVGRISGKLREQQQISADVQVSCRFRQKCCETFFTSRPPQCDVVLQLNVQNKIRSNSKIWFLFRILSVWSPVQQRSLLRSPARCQHLLCPSPWQWVSVPSLSVCLSLTISRLLSLLNVPKPVQWYESLRRLTHVIHDSWAAYFIQSLWQERFKHAHGQDGFDLFWCGAVGWLPNKNMLLLAHLFVTLN